MILESESFVPYKTWHNTFIGRKKQFPGGLIPHEVFDEAEEWKKAFFTHMQGINLVILPPQLDTPWRTLQGAFGTYKDQFPVGPRPDEGVRRPGGCCAI